MEKSITKFAFLLAGLGVVIFLMDSSNASGQATAQSTVNPLYKVGTEFTTGLDLPSPIRPFRSLIEKERYAAAAIKETEGCKTLEDWEPVISTRNHWRSISPIASFNSMPGVLAIAAQSNCVKVGYPAMIATFDRATGLSTQLGFFLPTGISARRPQFKDQEDVMLASAGLLGFDGPVVFVSGRVISSYPSETGGPYAPRMSGVRFISREQMEAAIQDGTQIIDVRSKKQFSLAHVKGATHVPYTPGPRMKVLDEYAAYAKSGDAFDIRRINQDREKPVILIGETSFSDGAYRAAVVLRSEGWKKIFVFFEGYSYFAQMAWKPPATSALVQVPSFSTMADVRNNPKVHFVDVRTDREFLDGTIRGAVVATYKERDDMRLHRSGLSGKALMVYGDSWNPPAGFDKSEAIVLIGQDQYDWRGYKAALMANSLGFKKVFWFRDGIAAWKILNFDEPSRFPVSQAGVTK